jgi:putative transcriptional regulator
MTGDFEQSEQAASYCFPELAPLYALGVLSQAEQQWVEQQIADSPELAMELAQYERTVGALPYDTTVLPTEATMQQVKGKLFDRLNLPMPEPITAPVAQSPEPASTVVPFMALRSEALQWRPGRVPKTEVALLHVDQARRERVALFRAEADMTYPAHRHGGTEEIYMLSGDLTLNGVTYYAGDYIRSIRGSQHDAGYSAQGCMFFVRSSMDDIYPEPG